MEKNDALIYGVKSNNKFHYIGKTIKKIKNDNGTINNSKINVQYHNLSLRDIFKNYKNVSVEPIILVPENKWYSEKLREVVEHNEHPLVNAKWMLEGKNGYWQGKKRDANTLLMLSQSKFKQFVEYDKNGQLKKIWKSGKEIGIKIFKDYEIVNGSGSTKLYQITLNPSIKKRFKFNSYWFKLDELIIHFNGIPEKLNIQSIIKKENENRRLKRENEKESRKQMGIYNAKRYSVVRCEITTGDVITIYKNVNEAAYKLKLCIQTIRRLCTGKKIKPVGFILKYGEKISQPKNISYPKSIHSSS